MKVQFGSDEHLSAKHIDGGVTFSRIEYPGGVYIMTSKREEPNSKIAVSLKTGAIVSVNNEEKVFEIPGRFIVELGIR